MREGVLIGGPTVRAREVCGTLPDGRVSETADGGPTVREGVLIGGPTVREGVLIGGPTVREGANHHRSDVMAEPLAYLITWTCYGTWLHGDERGSVDRHGRNGYGHPLVSSSPGRRSEEESRLSHPPFSLATETRQQVLSAIQDVSVHRGWALYAAHVRSNHVHVVLGGAASPERMMNDFKAYASRRLNAVMPEWVDLPKWTRHGSTRYLWKPTDLEAAIRYVVEEQGEPMAVCCPSDFRLGVTG